MLRKKDSSPYPVLSQEKSSYGQKAPEVICLWDADWGALKPTESTLAETARRIALKPVMEDLMMGLESLAALQLYGTNNSASRNVYLPKALQKAGICREHDLGNLEEAMNLLLQKGVLVPDWEFTGEAGSPRITDSSRHSKVGVWFEGGSRSKAEEGGQHAG